MQRAHALASHISWLSQRHRKHGFVPSRIMCPAFLATRDACVQKSRIHTSQGKAQGEKNTGCGEVRRRRAYHTNPAPSSQRGLRMDNSPAVCFNIRDKGLWVPPSVMLQNLWPAASRMYPLSRFASMSAGATTPGLTTRTTPCDSHDAPRLHAILLTS